MAAAKKRGASFLATYGKGKSKKKTAQKKIAKKAAVPVEEEPRTALEETEQSTEQPEEEQPPEAEESAETEEEAEQEEATASIPQERGRFPVGITNFDPLIQGGLRKGSISLVAGDAGSGKTIFALQFLVKGLQNKESCLYLTFEEKKDKLFNDMVSFGWNLKSYEDKKRLFYLEYNPEQVKSLIEEGGGTVDQLISKHKITRLVIDSVTSFSLLYQDELAKKEAGLALFELINKWGCTAVLTSQATTKGYTLESSSLEFEADNIILLYHFREKGLRTRGLEVLKMRGTKHTNKTMALEITNKGLVVYPDKVIKVDEQSSLD